MSSIAILINSFSGGGAERSMNILANEFHKNGFETSAIAVNSGPEDVVPRECATYCLERNWKAGFLETLKSRKKLKTVLNSLNPDSIIVNCELPELLIALTRTKSEIFVVEHASDPWRGRKFIGLIIRTILIAKRVKWVAVSSDLKFWPGLAKFSAVIKNPIVKEYLRPEKELSKSNQPPRLVFIGRLSEEKQPDMFLEICKETKMPGIIFGDGPKRAELENAIKSENINVEMHGFTKFPWQEISSDDLIIVTSKNEGDGLVVAEAIVLGIPILLLDTPDLRRFQLPNFFYNLSGLDFKWKILRCEKKNFEQFKVISELKLFMIKDRGIGYVSKNWENLLANGKI
jgi:glycosyltransferase involved in cell wall biosynthesis